MVTNKKEIFYFYLGFLEVKVTIAHSENCLPEFEIQSGFSNFYRFCIRVGSISRDSTFNVAFISISTRNYQITGLPMDFIPYIEDEVIRYSVSDKLDRPLVNP